MYHYNNLHLEVIGDRVRLIAKTSNSIQLVCRRPFTPIAKATFGIRVIKCLRNFIYFGFMNKCLSYNHGMWYKYNTATYNKLCGGKNLIEDEVQTGLAVPRLKVGKIL